MDTLVSARGCHHAVIGVATREPTEFTDITGHLDRLVSEAGVRVGTLTLQTLHTTTAIVVNEHEPLLLVDFGDCSSGRRPSDAPYRHDDPTPGDCRCPPTSGTTVTRTAGRCCCPPRRR